MNKHDIGLRDRGGGGGGGGIVCENCYSSLYVSEALLVLIYCSNSDTDVNF